MKVKRYDFPITDFEEVYAVIDESKQRLHLSSVNYSFSITLDLSKDLNTEIEQSTKWGEVSFNQKVRKVITKIINDEPILRRRVRR